MRTISVIQPSELGEDFKFEDGLWKVNFPAGVEVPPAASSDANNALTNGSDKGAFLDKNLLNAYAMVQDNVTKKIELFRFPAGTDFNIETAEIVSSVDMVELNGVFDDIAIDDGVITFTDAQSGLVLTLDTNTLQRIADVNGSDSIDVAEHNGILTLSVIVNDDANNLLEDTENGLQVDGYNVFNKMQEMGITAQRHSIRTTSPEDEADGVIQHDVGNQRLEIPVIMMVNSAGEELGLIYLPSTATIYSEEVPDT